MFPFPKFTTKYFALETSKFVAVHTVLWSDIVMVKHLSVYRARIHFLLSSAAICTSHSVPLYLLFSKNLVFPTKIMASMSKVHPNVEVRVLARATIKSNILKKQNNTQNPNLFDCITCIGKLEIKY